jgi:phospholipase C
MIVLDVCGTSHLNIVGKNITDYVVHHEPFQYYQSTANQHHLPPTSIAMIGHTDQANHHYDLSDFWSAAQANNLPAVSYLKAPAYQDGHPGVSDPIDEQPFFNLLWHTERREEQLDIAQRWDIRSHSYCLGSILRHALTVTCWSLL